MKAGTVLARCGNTGNSGEPHLHFHVETSPEPLEGDGLPIQFESAMVDGEVVEDVELIQGMKVAPAP